MVEVVVGQPRAEGQPEVAGQPELASYRSPTMTIPLVLSHFFTTVLTANYVLYLSCN